MPLGVSRVVRLECPPFAPFMRFLLCAWRLLAVPAPMAVTKPRRRPGNRGEWPLYQ